MDFDGNKHYIGIVGKGDVTSINSFPGTPFDARQFVYAHVFADNLGHVMQFRSLVDDHLIYNLRVPKKLRKPLTPIRPCEHEADELSTQLFEPGRDEEFDGLSRGLGSCEPAGKSSAWSCARVLTAEQWNVRCVNLFPCQNESSFAFVLLA
jgi:hypothetical protein